MRVRGGCAILWRQQGVSQIGTSPGRRTIVSDLSLAEQRLLDEFARSLESTGVSRAARRSRVPPYVPYTARRPIVQEFTPSAQEKELAALVADYLRRPSVLALPAGQRQLISLVLWKLLASSSRAITGALATMAERLQNLLNSGNSEALAQSLDEDYEGLADTADEWEGDEDESALASSERATIAAKIAELRPVKKPSPIER